jgi:UrcA family protein
MTDLTARISAVAMLGLAALPFAALATHVQAAPARVAVGDLNLNTEAGVARFHQRVERAARTYCADELSLHVRMTCRQGVRAEMIEKLPAVQQAQQAMAQRTLATR